MEENILDATCGGRSIWIEGNKEREDTLYIDRRETAEGNVGHGDKYSVDPDEVQDFRDLPYEDESFDLVVFDPPHLVKDDGQEQLSGVIQKKYGALHAETWQSDLRQGFEELFRVLRPGGTLVFKFADSCIGFDEVLKEIPYDPLFGTNTKKGNLETRWFVFHRPRDFNGSSGE